MKKRLSLGLGVALSAVLAGGASVALFAQQPPATKTAQEPRIVSEVNLVMLLAGVLDSSGRPVADLPRDVFSLYEEGVPQKIELFEAETNQPLDLALMIDASLSTFKELAFEREAAAHFIRQVVRPGDRLSVFQVSDTVEQLSEFSGEVSRLQAAVRAVQPGSATSLYDGVYLASQALAKRPTGRRRVIVLLTDAGETASTSTFEQARRAAIGSEALLYTILIRPIKSESGRNTAGEHALINIADNTGGVMYTADEVGQLDEIFDRVDRELRTQYRIGYYPTPRPPARSFRRIELRVQCKPEVAACNPPAGASGGDTTSARKPGEFQIRFRKGYFTPE